MRGPAMTGERKDKGKVRKEIPAPALPLLQEAYRRFGESEGAAGRPWTLENLTRAWTGLGYLTAYRPAIDAGLMQPVTNSVPQPHIKRSMAWWRLTDKGAKIVLGWYEDKAAADGVGSENE